MGFNYSARDLMVDDVVEFTDATEGVVTAVDEFFFETAVAGVLAEWPFVLVKRVYREGELVKPEVWEQMNSRKADHA